MAASKMSVFLALALASGNAEKIATVKGQAQVEVAANPIRKVVTMMQEMSQKLEKEAEQEEELYEKFECYCKKTQASIQQSIDTAKSATKIRPEDIDAKKNEIKALKNEVAKLKKDKIDDEETLQAAKVTRGNEHEIFVKVVAEEKETEEAAEGALKALGENPSFLQMNSHGKSHSGWGAGKDAKWLPKLLRGFEHSKKATENFVMQKKASAFLQGKGNEDGTDSADVVVYIKDIEHEAEDQIVVEDKEEDSEVVSYNGVKMSKKEEIAALLNLLEKKMRSISNLQVEVANMQHDMENGAESLEDNQKMLAEVKKNCAEKAASRDERKKFRAEEQLALADTIKMLNSDDALELFKKTIKTSSLIQISAAKTEAVQKAQVIINALKAKNPKHRATLNFLALKLSGKQVDFSTVFKKIDEMVALMKTEQQDDDSKKSYCNAEFDKSAEKIKDGNAKMEQVSADMDVAKKGVEKLQAEMVALQAGIKELDANVAEASKNRKAEHAETDELVAGNTEAIKLLNKAKNRLHKFYKPSLHITTTTTTEDPYATFVQISEHRALEAPPTVDGAYQPNKAGSNGILKMMETFVNDLEKEITIAETEEKNSQKDFVEMVDDAKTKRDADTKAIAGKAETKADLEGNLLEARDAKKAQGTELMEVQKYVSDLHAECDWLLSNFDLRKKARIEETESMTNAKSVLKGADPNLLG